MSCYLETKNLDKFYGSLHALKNFTFKAEKGEIIALLGPNGAGKSTLMNMISGYLAPSGGQIKIMGNDLHQDILSAKRCVGFLPEGAPLYSDMTVYRFLKYMSELLGCKKSRVNEILKLANIEHVKNQKIETLSKGYLRRVGFAQSILNNPPILLLDEPTDGLDPNQKEYIRKLIGEMGREKTIIISTHLLEEAESVCNRVIIISNGEMKADGTVEQILKQTKTKNLPAAFRKLTKTQDE